MDKIYFKQHLESCDMEWTTYGCYSETDIQREGDVLCTVHSIVRDNNRKDLGHIEYDVHKDYIETDEIINISKEEYLAVISKLKDAENYLSKAEDILETVIGIS